MGYNSIDNFITDYSKGDFLRLHMPGHKGAFGYGSDITEVTGADSLYEADGIILESENRTSELYGTRHTYFGTEGSSQMIKAMCCLAMNKHQGEAILASRNAHKAFIHAAMMLGFDIMWLPSEDEEYSLVKCTVTPEGLKKYLDGLKSDNIAAVYITSPDYLGNILDIKGLAEVAHSYGLLLLVDNAHGAYLKFMDAASSRLTDLHPITLGADMCVDSAHKTLPVLTGGAYLHISKTAPEYADNDIRQTLLMFGSTSPSYLILKSLDMMPDRVSEDIYSECAFKVAEVKEKLKEAGFLLSGNEPLKITIDTSNLCITGKELLNTLHDKKVECEYADRDFLVTMWSPYLPENAYEKFAKVMTELAEKILLPVISSLSGEEYNPGESRPDQKNHHLKFSLPEAVYSPREVMFRPHKREQVSYDLIGRIAADTYTGCPPAVSPVVAGERITKEIIDILKYYEIETINVIE